MLGSGYTKMNLVFMEKDVRPVRWSKQNWV